MFERHDHGSPAALRPLKAPVSPGHLASDQGLPGAVAHVGSFPPRACGIATYTRDVAEAAAGALSAAYHVVAVEEEAGAHAYARPVLARLLRDEAATYAGAAAAVNRSGAAVVNLQHEYGLFGGAAGDLVLRFLERVRLPVVTTFHTAVPDPDPDLYRVTRAVAARSCRLVVLAETAAAVFERDYGLDRRRFDVIPHGVPAFRLGEPARREAKQALDLGGRFVLSTFGLLGRGKGIEEVLLAMPAIVAADPRALYVVAGVTHPGVLRQEGEAYRHSLEDLVHRLGLGQHVRFDNRYLPDRVVRHYLEAADVYVMAYPGRHQVVSGTLAYALGAGRAVVATPFTYAREVLADGRGLLVPFGDSEAIARAVVSLIERPADRERIERRAGALGRTWQWPYVGAAYARLWQDAAPGLVTRAPIAVLAG